MPSPTTRTGVVVIRGDGVILSADPVARSVVQMPAGAPGRQTARYHLLDQDGRPLQPGSTIQRLEVGVVHSALRAVRFDRREAFVWCHAEYLRTGFDEATILVSPTTKDPPRQRGWNCSACGKPTMAVADHHARDLCLECWIATWNLTLADTATVLKLTGASASSTPAPLFAEHAAP